jgi:dTDP-4-dehydrorhamnose 3,5-epimerase
MASRKNLVKVFKSEALNNIKIKNLVVHSDDRGFLFELLRCDDKQFAKFGQCYVNYTEPGVIKGFHYHNISEDNFVCLSGRIKLVLLDDATEEARDMYLGPQNLMLVNIPVGLYHGWKALGMERSCVINISSEAYNPKNPDEFRVAPTHFPWYSWETVNR